MEKWKLAVIVFLIGALGGYGAYQSRSPQQPNVAENVADGGKRPTLPIQSFLNQPVPQWQIADKSRWVNTPRPLSSGDFKGQVTLMEFFRIDCSHCQDAVPFMKYMHQTYAPKGLKVVALQSPVTQREKNWNATQEQIKNWALKYPVAQADPKVFTGTFKGTNFPSTLLIDKSGVVRFVETGYDPEKAKVLEEKVKSLLGAGAADSKETASPAPQS